MWLSRPDSVVEQTTALPVHPNLLLSGKWEMQLIDLQGQQLITKRATPLTRPNWVDYIEKRIRYKRHNLK